LEEIMVQIQNIAQILLGLVIAFSGANIFRSSPPLGGFIVGGVVAANLANTLFVPPAGWEFWMPLVAFLAGGLIGALIAIPLHVVVFVLTGTALGIVTGMLLGFLINQQGMTHMIVNGIFTLGSVTPLQIVLMAVFGIGFGLLSIRFDEMMTAASTAFLGSLSAVSGITFLATARLPIFTNSIFLGFLWFILGLLGWIWQSYHVED
jgi:hypothetical protein